MCTQYTYFFSTEDNLLTVLGFQGISSMHVNIDTDRVLVNTSQQVDTPSLLSANYEAHLDFKNFGCGDNHRLLSILNTPGIVLMEEEIAY